MAHMVVDSEAFKELENVAAAAAAVLIRICSWEPLFWAFKSEWEPEDDAEKWEWEIDVVEPEENPSGDPCRVLYQIPTDPGTSK